MRVLHVLRDLSCNGGVQRLVFEMATALHSGLAAEVLVYRREPGPEYLDSLRKAGVPVHVVPRWNLWRQWRLMRSADVVHAHLFPALYTVALLRPGGIYTEHNTTNNRRKYRWLRFAERWAYSRYGAVTCISPEVQQALRIYLGTPDQDNTVVVYNGVNVAALAAKPSLRLPIRDRNTRGFHVAMVGSLTAKKDQETLIRAIAQMPPDVHLHLAGAGPEQAPLEALAHQLQVCGRVQFHGVVTDVGAFLSEADVYVQSSKWEGFGLAALEAMACGLPVLCSDVPGLNNLASSRALLFARGDATQLAHLLTRCREDQNFRDELLELSRKVPAKYSIERMLACLASQYRRTIVLKPSV